jgi:hypothetical protein
MNPGHLVWIRDFAARPRPEWWAELFYGTDNQYRTRIVATYPVDPELLGKSLDELCGFYPPPAEARS